MTQHYDPTTLNAQMANAIRILAMDAVQQANSGHPGMPMGIADVATILCRDFLKVSPKNPTWPNRDRFVLSAGHGSMLLYAMHYLLGYDDMSMDEVQAFRQLHRRTAGHPEYGHAMGIETTTGPLGQGLATAVGMAIGERMSNARFTDDIINHYTYVIAGDGCLQEGISHEAIDLAGHLQLHKLIVLWDDNNISIDGTTSLSTSMNQQARFEAAGWDVQSIDGHDHKAIYQAITNAQLSNKPSFIACKTTIGFGSPTLAGTAKTHGAPLGADEIAATKKYLQVSAEPFAIDNAIIQAWRAIAATNNTHYDAWATTLTHSGQQQILHDFLDCKIPKELSQKLTDFKQHAINDGVKVASRKASQMVLEVVNDAWQATIGGSADLTGSNLTKTPQQHPISSQDYTGRYIYYGIREHGMAAAMNGLSLYGGFVPYGGTFMVFTDYARGAMRLSALMGQQVIYVMTHDSIGLGEDGPTHQPIEHLAMLRATPNMLILRPADIVETAECWELALQRTNAPSVLVLSRQNLPLLRHDCTQNHSAKGGYIIHDYDGTRDYTLIATGSEVSLAIEAAQQIFTETGKKGFVISLPSWELLDEQDQAYRQQLLGSAPIIGIEAASEFGWHKWLGHDGHFIGMQSFGASGPADELYEYFGITTEKLCAKIHTILA